MPKKEKDEPGIKILEARKARQGRAVICTVDHPGIGRIEGYTATSDDPDPIGQAVWEAVQKADIAPEEHLPAHVQRERALRRVDERHADMLQKAARGATKEEQATWPGKVAGAIFVQHLSDGALAGHIDLLNADDPKARPELAALVAEIGVRPEDLRALSDSIFRKNRTQSEIIGKASRLRRKARAEIEAATSEDLPLEDVAAKVEAALTNMEGGQ